MDHLYDVINICCKIMVWNFLIYVFLVSILWNLNVSTISMVNTVLHNIIQWINHALYLIFLCNVHLYPLYVYDRLIYRCSRYNISNFLGESMRRICPILWKGGGKKMGLKRSVVMAVDVMMAIGEAYKVTKIY